MTRPTQYKSDPDHSYCPGCIQGDRLRAFSKPVRDRRMGRERTLVVLPQLSLGTH